MPLFSGLSFCLSGTLSTTRTVFEGLLRKHGGDVGSGVTKKTTHLVTTPNEVSSATAKVVKAQSQGCAIVSEAFVLDSIKAKKVKPTKDYDLQRRGGGAREKVSVVAVKPATSTKRSKKQDEDEEEDEEQPETKKRKQVSSKVGESDVTKLKASNALKGVQVCLSGTLSMKRKEFEDLIKKHGGEASGSVSKKTTHLVTTADEVENETAKVKKAQELSVPLVSEDFILESLRAKKALDPKKFSIGGSDDDEDEDEDEEEEAEEEEEEEKPKSKSKKQSPIPEVDVTKMKASKVLNGVQACLSGTLSMKRKEFEDLVKKHGGVASASVSKKTTHLITTVDEVESGTSKVDKARELDIPLVTENFVIQSIVAQRLLDAKKFIVAGEDNDDEGGEDGDKEEEEEEEDEEEEEIEQPPYTEEYFGKLLEEANTKTPDWYKDANQWSFVINQWFHGAPVDSFWAALGARPVAYLANIKSERIGWPSFDKAPESFEHEYLFDETTHLIAFEIVDGTNQRHMLAARVNEGFADSNTGYFGRVASAEGVWTLFRGYMAGDCGTAVAATQLALKRYRPYSDDANSPFRKPILNNITYNNTDNTYSTNSQIERILFQIAGLTQKGIGINVAPFNLRVNLTKSLLTILQKKAFAGKQVSPLWPVKLPPRILGLIAHYAAAPLPVFDQERYKAYKDGAPQEKINRCAEEVMEWDYVKTEKEPTGGDDEDDEEDEEHKWDMQWVEGMEPYSKQLSSWQLLQDYDAKKEYEMLKQTDYKLGVLEIDF